ncbi:MAG: ABC transporter ATP-binding protein [Chloroflexi bacterium]|nr:ABC transporter ATP-binding protein [Chloroflexota bacterium]
MSETATPAATPTATAAVELRAISHRYPGRRGTPPLRSLDGVTVEVGEGEFVSLVGPSGCGKTTLLRIAAGLLTPSGGSARVLGEDPANRRGAPPVGLVTQEPGLLPWRTAAGNVALTHELAGGRATRADVLAQLGRVGIRAFADFHPRELSGGMRQRVALARALAHEPRLLLMDEPFGALDELSREEMRRELLRIWERERISVLFVTHSIREAVLLSDRVVVMSPGPGRVVANLPIELPRPRAEGVEETTQFSEHARRVRAALEGGA